uniref:Major facilitator superfamily (MFS) profile domain-containing protein n=1 Tax=Araucaria cunninghamii TaxID=56994 RepID=A0A0D6QZH3_ARACU
MAQDSRVLLFERSDDCNNGEEASKGAFKSRSSRWSFFSFVCCAASQKGVQSNENREKSVDDKIESGLARDLVKKKVGGWRTMPFIFANELSEKLAVVGFSANMVSYLTQELHFTTVKAANTLTNFGGTASLTPLLGAFIADAYAGRFWTIAVASIIYQIGMIVLTVSAVMPTLRPPPCKEVCKEASSGQLGILYFSLLLTALGSGGIRPCVVAFGADQFDEKDPEQGKKLWNFFNWYYFCMGLSILTAVTVIVYIQDNIGWGWGLGIPAAAMAVSIVTFFMGLPLYRHFKPAGSPLTRLLQVIVAAIRKRHLTRPADQSLLYQDKEKDAVISPSGTLTHTNQLTFFDAAAIPIDSDITEGTGTTNPWRLCTVHQVEELKSIIRMGPIWAAGILLITASAQQNTFSLMQAKTMNRRLGSSSFEIPAGSMGVFTILSLLLTITLYDRLLMPVARRFTGRGRGISFLQRMGVGFFISVLATLVAGFVEVKRKAAAADAGLLDRPKAMIPVSVFWLVPQYSLHGMAEAFMSIGHLEFFYDQSPESMRSTATALFWTSISAGSYFSTFLVSTIHHVTSRNGHRNWLPANLNRGRLEYFYWLVTLLQVVNLLYYLVCARFYTYKPVAVVAAPADIPHKQAASDDDVAATSSGNATIQLATLQPNADKIQFLKPHRSL